MSAHALLALLPLLGSASQDDPWGVPEVRPVSDDWRAERGLDPFYVKRVDVAGFPILGSARVSDAAVREAAWIVRHVLEGRDDVLQALAEGGVHMVVMAHDEYTTDVPEQRDMQPRVFWDRRARGLGGTPVSCAEENLLCFPEDPYSTENILIHEFAHVVHSRGVGALDPTFDERLRAAYEAAMEAGLWEGTYAAGNRAEYWAEGVQSWFDDNRENDALHNHVDTRAELLEYDPALAALCREVYGDHAWRYAKPLERDPAGRAHLQDVDWQHLPAFRWREEPIPPHPRVLVQTELGDIELELDYEHAPLTVANFLHYVHQGYYSDGGFFRTVTADNQPDREVKIAGIQARADPAKADRFPPPIPLERTNASGLTHLDGTITMAREGPDSARDQFFLCIGDQPALDFGGRRAPDGQGFAAFGRVVRGMDVVRRIQGLPAEGQTLREPLRIQRAVRRN